MTVCVGINSFGHIGRTCLGEDVEVVAINCR